MVQKSTTITSKMFPAVLESAKMFLLYLYTARMSSAKIDAKSPLILRDVHVHVKRPQPRTGLATRRLITGSNCINLTKVTYNSYHNQALNNIKEALI